MSSPLFTLITGAGQGIGYAFAEECASRKMNLVLVSLQGEGLKEKGAALQATHDVFVHVLELDLTQQESCTKLFNYVHDEGLRVNMLINNAGIGSNGAFEGFSPEFYQKQIYLNITVPVTLTRIFIPILQKESQAYILNVSSMGAFFNMPQKEVYNASKSFLFSFTRSLQIHLEGSSISLSVVCPGPVDSNPRLVEIHQNLKGLAKKAVLKPSEVAKIALDGLITKKPIIIPGKLNRLILALNGWIPAALKKSMMKKEMTRQANLTKRLKSN